ncbi:hypothetical protein F5884DRAFT_879848 [Xylogone sp. PMI_703]|nr:hypothetical protein F5884DRAFT_879848 [Xylogone sp. PMI_703]
MNNQGPRSETGSYILRSLIKDVALSTVGDDQSLKITCVEAWNGNLYIGTSAGEILHYAQLPAHPSGPDSQPIFILASRLQPPVNQQQGAGIQHILLLPRAGKICILSNNTLNFYTIPELSPAFPRLDPLTCSWLCGVDLNVDGEERQDDAIIMVCLRNRIRLVKVAEQPLRIRDIEFRGCLAAMCRGDFACVADARAYALLDVASQQKIPLLDISALDNHLTENAGPRIQSNEILLKPLIATPNPGTFLIVTGTTSLEPGVGVLVNLDGHYMTSLQNASEVPEAGYILAVVRRQVDGILTPDVEIQRWDVWSSDETAGKEWLSISRHTHGVEDALGIRQIGMPVKVSLPEITDILKMMPLQLLGPGNESHDVVQAKREKEEMEFVSRLCEIDAQITLWIGDEVFWVLRNPLLLRLDASLHLAHLTSTSAIQTFINDIRGLPPQTELEFLTLKYIRQRASLLLFTDLVVRTASGTLVTKHDEFTVEEALVESEVDPRIVISFLPVRDEVLSSGHVIWIHAGLKELIDQFYAQNSLSNMPTDPAGRYCKVILDLVRRVLLFWRGKKGNPSVIESSHIFPIVDFALLHILLLLDSDTPRGPAKADSLRAELNSVVDAGVEDFEGAVLLLKQFKRLYILSRLYQSRNQHEKVLETWRNIINGEEDSGGEFTDGEQEVRLYLSKLQNQQLVTEYGMWLAKRNPVLGVQVFVDNSRIKWASADVLKVLRERAPGAVKEYLETLVFKKKQLQHINELIACYLDIVLAELRASERSRAILASTDRAYKALRRPKPAYYQFIANSMTSSDEWQICRSRLLQLLDGDQDAAFSYDVDIVSQRIEPFKLQLIPETIILHRRQGEHKEAIRLLTHSLCDFDTAISYCILCGSSNFRNSTDRVDHGLLLPREEQEGLFNVLLVEFLRIQNLSDRIELTKELLERFEEWFDILHVLPLLPSSWPVEIFSSFLVRALRRHLLQQRGTSIKKALSAADNSIMKSEFIKKVEGSRASVTRAVA